MKRLINHLLVSAITFSVGVTAGAVFKRQSLPQVQKTHVLESMPHVAPTPVKANISTPESHVVWDYDVDRFNPRGDYYILGRKPKEFREFDGLELSVYPSDGKALGQLRIQIVVDQTYQAQYAVFGLVTEHGVSFATTAPSDTQCEYTFHGYFLRSGVLSDADKREAVLEGRITKSKNGIRIAAAKIRFRIEYLGC